MKASSNRTAKRHVMTVMAATASLWLSVAPGTAHADAPNPTRAARTQPAPKVQLADGIVEGVKMRGEYKDLRVFRGIPYAAPPVNEFRFRDPQPVARWAGVKNARQFGPRCMQPGAESKRDFRSNTMSEDCLYLNVWTPAHGAGDKLPVMVYFHGGGFVTGDGSEPRYDGAGLASRGIVTVTVNSRLGVFGFLASPEAARESSNGTAGNYGLLDQVAALRWVRDNIAQFGGDPSKVTIAGNSSGSIAVSAHMASPLSRGLFARAIGESGAAFAPRGMWQREQAEQAATKFAARVGAGSLQQLRSLPAQTLLDAANPRKAAAPSAPFLPSIDGHFLTETPEQVFTNGGQAQVPLLLGANSQEAPYTAVLGDLPPTPENWHQAVKTTFPAHAEEVLAHYPGNDNEEVVHAGTALASDIFIGHSTWKWMEQHRQTGNSPVFYYRYTQSLPPEIKPAAESDQPQKPVLGATHDAQIPYALGNLKNMRRYAWTAADYNVSRIFSSYIEQFVKTGNPSGTTSGAGATSTEETMGQNGSWLPQWPAVRADNRGLLMQVIGESTNSVWDDSGPRQALVQRLVANAPWNGVTTQSESDRPATPPAR